MSFYQEMCSAVQEKTHQQSNPEAIGRVFDEVFDEFRKFTGWPADKILFSRLELPTEFEQKPSKVLSATEQGRMGVTVRIECGTEKHDMPCFMSWKGGNTFRFYFERENRSFSSIRSLEVKAVVELMKSKVLHRITDERNAGDTSSN